MLTRRALAVLLLPTLVLAFAALAPEAAWSALTLALGVTMALVADILLAPKASDFRVSRQHEPYLSIGIPNPITLTVTYGGKRPTAFIARDEAPALFGLERAILDGRDVFAPEGRKGLLRRGGPVPIRQGEAIRLQYAVTPPRRGDYAFGGIHLRWNGPFGLVRRQAAWRPEGSVRVFPNLLDIRKYDLLMRVGRTQELGLRRARAFGEGEFESLRDYTVDDQVRRIDWRATARRSKVTVQQLQTERSQSILALVDCGRLMEAPSDPGEAPPEPGRSAARRIELQKIDAAVSATLMLSYVAGQRGDRVGALAFADDVIAHLAPRQGKAQFYRMLSMLYWVQARPIESDYARAFSFVAAQQRKRAFVVVFTDLANGLSANELARRLAPLRRRHLVLLVTISDPTLIRLSERAPHDATTLYRQSAAEEMIEARAQTLDHLKTSGIHTLDVPADKLSISVVNRYLALKARHLL
ncbi:MAG: DUF58 domain-containing protein [Thermoflexales bacterium]